jgi:inhibitor of KinA sporulation pathway (predicted exonuclease)
MTALIIDHVSPWDLELIGQEVQKYVATLQSEVDCLRKTAHAFHRFARKVRKHSPEAAQKQCSGRADMTCGSSRAFPRSSTSSAKISSR